jgi:hypothetical protein
MCRPSLLGGALVGVPFFVPFGLFNWLARMAAFIEANNPHIISYGLFFVQDATRMTVVAVHPDSATLAFHMNVGDTEFRKFGELVDLFSIAVYGEVSDDMLEHLQRKAGMLGAGSVAVYHSGKEILGFGDLRLSKYQGCTLTISKTR